MREFCERLEEAVRDREPVDLWGVTYVPDEGAAGAAPSGGREAVAEALGRCRLDNMFVGANVREIAHAVGAREERELSGTMRAIRDRMVELLSEPRDVDGYDTLVADTYRKLRRALGDMKHAHDVYMGAADRHRAAASELESERATLRRDAGRRGQDGSEES